MSAQPGIARSCEWCGGEIPDRMRRDAVMCSRNCKNMARRARKRKEAQGVTNTWAGTPVDGRAWSAIPDDVDEWAGSPDDESGAGSPSAAQRIAATRFRRYLNEQTRQVPVVPAALAATQRRNPGVVIPEIAKLQTRRSESTEQRTDAAELRDETAVAARGRASRAANRPKTYERLPADEFPDISTWATVPAPPVYGGGPGPALGRRMPARYLNG